MDGNLCLKCAVYTVRPAPQIYLVLNSRTQEIQCDHRTDSDPRGFYLISVKPMKSYRHPSHRTALGSLVFESYGTLVSELDGIQCNVVTDSVDCYKE